MTACQGRDHAGMAGKHLKAEQGREGRYVWRANGQLNARVAEGFFALRGVRGILEEKNLAINLARELRGR